MLEEALLSRLVVAAKHYSLVMIPRPSFVALEVSNPGMPNVIGREYLPCPFYGLSKSGGNLTRRS